MFVKLTTSRAIRSTVFLISFTLFLALNACTNDNSDNEGELEYILPDEETGQNLSSKPDLNSKESTKH